MIMEIVGQVDKDRLFCSGSFTKLLTTYISLSLFAEKYELEDILDDENFLDKIATNSQARSFLNLFQELIGSKFSLHDIYSYYSGLPYTFDVTEEELLKVDLGEPFKHHSVPSEELFLNLCKNNITPIYKNRCKFHYSEISIIFLGYLIEKIYDTKIEELYNKFVIKKFNLKNSVFSRKRVANLYIEDLSDRYDYPSIAILDHGYFCYSNGFFTTLNDMKIVLENILCDPIFKFMSNIKHARAASNTLMNGLTVEIRTVKDDILYGYEGLSFSGCNIWCYSTKHEKGYITFTDDEEAAYDIYNLFDYETFDKAKEHTQIIYKNFLKNSHDEIIEKEIPLEFRGDYQRVRINDKILETKFQVGNNFIVIRNPDIYKYDVIYVKGNYHIKGKDNLQSSKIGLIKSKDGNRYMYHDGTLYRKTD